jgi:Ankyrin repeats (3 copies)/NB-ARC domain
MILFQTPLKVHELHYYHDEAQEKQAELQCSKLKEAIESEMQDGGDASPAKPFPSLAFLQTLSEAAYETPCQVQKPWLQFKDIYCKDNTLRARIYINTVDRQLLIAFKGTDSWGDWGTNINSVFRGKAANKHCNSAATVGALARDILEQFHGRMLLIITGHSLGGYLAQLAAFAAQNLRIVDGKFKTVDQDNCIEIYPHTVVFDSPPAAERILQSTFVNPISIENLRLDVTNYIICANMVNSFSEITRHLGRIIVLKKDDSKPLKFSFWVIFDHLIRLYKAVNHDKKSEVVDLNNMITEPFDEFSISSMAFSKKEYDALKILPILKTLPTKTELNLNFNIYKDSVKIFNEEPNIFVPRMRLFLLENSEILKDHVGKIKNFQMLIFNDFWKTLYPDFQDLNINLNPEHAQALLGADGDVHIKCDKPFREKIIMAQMIRNSIPNTYFLSYKHYKGFSTELIQYFISNFEGRLILLLENNETFEGLEIESIKACKFIIFSKHVETTNIKLKLLENVKVEIVSEESRILIENKRVPFFNSSIPIQELCKFLPNDVDLIELLDFVLSHSQIDNASPDSKFYVQQSAFIVSKEMSYIIKCFSSSDVLIRSIAEGQGFKVLSADPGMGKTTFFSHLQSELTNSLPNHWIVKINLLEHSKYLNDLVEKKVRINIKQAVEFIKQNEKNGRSAFQMKVLEFLIEKKRVFVIIDAFDEICPKYRKITMQIITALKTSHVRFAVSTRPQELEQIKKKLKCKEHIELLKIEDLGDFFKKYFVLREKLNVEDAQRKAESLMQKISNNDTSETLMSFWQIPLHALMVAELFSKSASSINMNNLSGLFEQFVEKRIGRDLEVKLNLLPTHPKQFKDFEKKKKSILKSLMLLAIREHFMEYQKPNVVKLATIKKHKRDINSTGIATILKPSRVKFSHYTFSEYLSIKFCLSNMENDRVIEVMKQILLDSTHFMMRKFLNEMVASSVWPNALIDFVQERSDEVLVRICKDDLLEVFRYLRQNFVSFEHNKAQRVVHSQESMWDEHDLPRPPKTPRISNEDEDSDFCDDDDDDSNVFPLTLAIRYASENLVLELIADGANLSRVLNSPLTIYEEILSNATMRKMPNVVKQILNIRPLKNEQDYDKLCIIHWAVRANNLELVKILFEAGASLSTSDKNGMTPLQIANERTNQQIIQFINEQNIQYQSPQVSTEMKDL